LTSQDPETTNPAAEAGPEAPAAELEAATTPGSPETPRASAAPAAPSPPPRRLGLGLGLFLGGGLATFFMMSQDAHILCGPLWGALTTFVACLGVLELCGLLRAQPSDRALPASLFQPLPGEPSWMAPRWTLPVALTGVAVSGLVLGPAALPLPILLGLLLLLMSGLRRPALFVFVAASLLLLPMLGSFGLWDPWETHYGEVAREILARDDWITLWWAQDEWFRSKPVLIFWIEALAWGALGVPFGADANPGFPEWPIRLPHYLLTMGALMACYGTLARIFGKRTAVIGSLVLATTPYFFLLAHQAITDMPFVATMTIALCLFALAVEEAPDAESARYRLGPFCLSLQGTLLAALVLVALPQALYLISRNVTFLVDEKLFSLHPDQFMFGSAGNSEIPGNPAIRTRAPYLPELWFQPLTQGVVWLLGLGALVWMLRGERRRQQLAMFGFYLACALSWMAKGIPGFALPGLIAGLYLLATGRWSLLLEGRLRVGAGMLAMAVTGLPWYVAMYGRLGPFFTDRLLIHDHINRHGQHPVLPGAARLRGLPLARPGAARLRGLHVPAARAGRGRPGHEPGPTAGAPAPQPDPAFAVGRDRVRAVQRDDHQVPPLHLPGGAAAGPAGRRVPRSRAGRRPDPARARVGGRLPEPGRLAGAGAGRGGDLRQPARRDPGRDPEHRKDHLDRGPRALGLADRPDRRPERRGLRARAALDREARR
jgi:hypothetical protein